MSIISQTKKINAVISFGKNKPDFALLKSFLEGVCDTYAFIYHDKDVLETGELKTPHIHLLCNLVARTRLITFATRLSEVLNININAITIDICKNELGSLQYLIHKNDKDKYPYDIESIVHNYNVEEFESIMTAVNNSISVDRIIQLCHECKSLCDLIKAVGLTTYHHYRPVILDIWREIHPF